MRKQDFNHGWRFSKKGSANPCTEEQYHTGTLTTYYGRALAIVRAERNCMITVTDGMETATASIQA